MKYLFFLLLASNAANATVTINVVDTTRVSEYADNQSCKNAYDALEDAGYPTKSDTDPCDWVFDDGVDAPFEAVQACGFLESTTSEGEGVCS